MKVDKIKHVRGEFFKENRRGAVSMQEVHTASRKKKVEGRELGFREKPVRFSEPDRFA